jgi:chromosomal replication initiator protein
LLHAAGNHAKTMHPSTRVKVVTGDEFITDFQSAISKKNMGDFRRRYRLETDLLLVDDLHSISRAKATQEEFFNLMNHIASTGRRMAITCDRPIDSLEGLEERIRSRLSGGLAIPMERPSAEGRVAILAIKLKRRGILLPENVLKDLSLSTEGCVRTLEGLVNRLAFMHRSGCLDAQSIRQMIKDVPVAPVRLTSSDIMNEVAKRYNLTLEDLRSKSRSRVQVSARRESMRRMKEELGLSLSEIGRLHLRDHSTVVHALRA